MSEPNERIYPCARCGTLRSKAEGGTTFTVCDTCWDATMKPTPPPIPDEPEAVRLAKIVTALNDGMRAEGSGSRAALDSDQIETLARAVLEQHEELRRLRRSAELDQKWHEGDQFARADWQADREKLRAALLNASRLVENAAMRTDSPSGRHQMMLDARALRKLAGEG